MALPLSVTPAVYEEQHLLAHLHQLLLYDLSPTTGADLDASGRYAAPQLAADPLPPETQPFLVRIAGNPAGFALIRLHNRVLPKLARTTCAALFIMRKYRLQGYGTAVACMLFDRFPGDWEVAADATYTPGHAFWRAVVDRYTCGRYAESWVQSHDFRGHVQTFTTVGAVAEARESESVARKLSSELSAQRLAAGD